MSKRSYPFTEGDYNTEQLKAEHATAYEEKDADAVQLIALADGIKVLIEFFFDCDGITLDDCKLVKDVNDLCFYFTRTQNDEPEAFPTIFNVEYGDTTLKMFDSNKDSARFRIGPFLALHLKNRTVAYQFLERSNDIPEYSMKVRIRYSEKDYFTTLSEDRREFANNICSRGIRVLTSEPDNIPVSTEVAGLFSTDFFNIFFSSKSMEEWVEIDEDTDVEAITQIIIDSAHRYNCPFDPNNWDRAASILEHCDRFCFIPQFQNYQKALKEAIRNCAGIENGFIEKLQDLSLIVRNNNLLREFTDKFCMPSCLEEWERANSGQINPEFGAIIAERKADLRDICIKRPK
ncbi:hypothetical protein PMAYCL1PPCAC_13403, partial [Pristionchus mayeri]